MIFPGASHLGVNGDQEGRRRTVHRAVGGSVHRRAFDDGDDHDLSVRGRTSRFRSGLRPCAIAWVLTAAILMLAPGFSRLLGPRGLRACERLMGMVLTVVAVQMLSRTACNRFFKASRDSLALFARTRRPPRP